MKKYAILIFLAGTILMVYIMNRTGASLKTPATPLGILNLEFAYDTVKTTVVMNAWAPASHIDNIAVAKLNTWVDFLFLFFYSFFLFFTCNKIAQAFPGPVEKAGRLISKAALLAGFFDILENTGMLLTLNGYRSAIIAYFTTVFSVLKFGLVIIAVLYVLLGLLLWVYHKFKD